MKLILAIALLLTILLQGCLSDTDRAIIDGFNKLGNLANSETDYTPSNPPIQIEKTKCKDGTKEGKCSESKPFICKYNKLSYDAGTCGCQSGKTAVGSYCIVLDKFENVRTNNLFSGYNDIYGFMEYIEVEKEANISIETKTSKSKIAVEIWNGIIPFDEHYWWGHYSQKAATKHLTDAKLEVELTPGKYSIMYLHWPKDDNQSKVLDISKKVKLTNPKSQEIQIN